MTIYVADTHALVWHLGGSKLLGPQARAAFDETINDASPVYVPAIVLAEAVMLIEKRHITLDMASIISALLRNLAEAAPMPPGTRAWERPLR